MEFYSVNELDLRRARGFVENPRLQSNSLNFGKLETSRVPSVEDVSETSSKTYRRTHAPKHRVCL